MSAAADYILASIQISQVWHALGGGELRHGRGQAWWRDGDGYNIALRDDKGVWHDKRDNTGGGVLDLIVLVRGGSKADALHWLADLAGIPLDDKPFTAEDRARWVQQQRQLERDMLKARYWRRSAVAMAEETLADLKRRMFDLAVRPEIRPEIGELREWTQRLARWQRLDGAELVVEYTAFTVQHPTLSAGMVHAARLREKAEVRALLEYFAATTAAEATV